MEPAEPATEKQLNYCKCLFRKTKFYYQCATDDKLIEEVKKRTGYDLSNLSKTEAYNIIKTLKNETDNQRRSHRQWGQIYRY